MNTLETLDRVQSEAQKRSDEEGDDFDRLAEICQHARHWEGSLQKFGVRAAIAEMAQSWLDHVANGSDPDTLLAVDASRAQQQLESFVETTQGPEDTSS